MEQLTPEIMLMFGLLALTVLLFASDMIRLDVGAVVILMLLGLTTLIPGLQPLIHADEIFTGFGSNAVIAIIAVMIISTGLNKVGLLNIIAAVILRYGQRSERKLTALICASAGLISSFMQNTGAAALYIPIVSRIASRSEIPLNRLLMPMGFAAIVGGTLTVVGSSPLILMNDLLPQSIEPIRLFEVTPVGVSLLTAAVLYFFFCGRYVLPASKHCGLPATATMDYLRQTYGLDAEIYELKVPASSQLIGTPIAEIEYRYSLRIIAAQVRNENRLAPARDIPLEPNTVIAVLSSRETAEHFAAANKLELRSSLQVFAESLTSSQAGISEILIPPNSRLVGKTIAEIGLRKSYGLTVLNLHRNESNHRQNLRDFVLRIGDTLVCHSSWKNLTRLLDDRDFVVVTTEFPHEDHRTDKAWFAVGFLLLAIGMVLLTPLPLAVSLFCGAIGMILTGVITMDEAYAGINWMTVFLLACLIPLGLAVDHSGTAAWIAQGILSIMGEMPIWVLLLLIGTLASLFSVSLSNVGATVLLVPLAVKIAITFNADPRLFALTTAVCASNSFILPTHQVNALILAPGYYKVKDYMRAGIGMTLIYLLVSVLILYWIF